MRRVVSAVCCVLKSGVQDTDGVTKSWGVSGKSAVIVVNVISPCLFGQRSSGDVNNKVVMR